MSVSSSRGSVSKSYLMFPPRSFRANSNLDPAGPPVLRASRRNVNLEPPSAVSFSRLTTASVLRSPRSPSACSRVDGATATTSIVPAGSPFRRRSAARRRASARGVPPAPDSTARNLRAPASTSHRLPAARARTPGPSRRGLTARLRGLPLRPRRRPLPRRLRPARYRLRGHRASDSSAISNGPASN